MFQRKTEVGQVLQTYRKIPRSRELRVERKKLRLENLKYIDENKFEENLRREENISS